MPDDIRVKFGYISNPKRLRLIRLLGIGADYYLLNLWITAAQSKPDGQLIGWDATDIADIARWQGDPQEFVDALIQCGWLEKDNSHYALHDWKEHQPWIYGSRERSELARLAGLASVKARQSRPSANVAPTTGQRLVNKPSTDGSTPSPSPSPSPSPKPPISPNGFAEFWEAYPKKVGKQDALKAFGKVKPDKPLLAKMLQSLEIAKGSDGWQKDGGRYIPHPSKWLNGRRWEDEIAKEAEGMMREPWPVR